MFGDRTPYPIPGAPPDFLSGETHPASNLLLLPRADPSARSLTRRVSTHPPLDPSLLCSASSPIAATVITFWALLITSMCKLEAASSADGIEWRMSHVDGELCFGECDSVRCNAFTDDARKFDKPTGMDEGCEWFPTTRTLPNSNLDYAATVVLSNLCSQLGSGLFLIFCGSLGDFGTMRHRGLKAGWLVFTFAPILTGALVYRSELFWISAILYVATSIAHLTAQQMFDAYLPLLAKSHPRSVAVAEGRWDPGPKASCLTQTLTLSIIKFNVTSMHGPREHGLKFDSAERPVAATKGLEGSKGAAEEGDGGETGMATVAARVAQTRQSVASEMALMAPALGFLSLTTVTAMQLLAVFLVGGDQLLGLRACVMLAGAWALVFGGIALRGIRVRRAPVARESDGKTLCMSMIWKMSARRTWLSVRMVWLHHPEVAKLLAGQMLSAITNGTFVSNFTVFARRELNATASDIIMVLFIAGFGSTLGTSTCSLLFSRLTPRQLSRTLVVLKLITPIWPLWTTFGFRRKFEMYLLAALGSLFNPTVLPLLRSIYQQIVPHGYESSLFSLLGVATVAFTWIGSLVVSSVFTATGSMRTGMGAVTAFVFVGVIFLLRFDVDAAQEHRRRIEEGDVVIADEFDELRSAARREERGPTRGTPRPVTPDARHRVHRAVDIVPVQE